MPDNVMQTQTVVIGAGVIGCAVAAELARGGKKPIVLEAGARIAEGITSRNSGVIHAGIYYKPGSLKAESCVRGNALLYEWCAAKGVPHQRTGKWIVAASSEDEPELLGLYDNARACGAGGLSLRKQSEVERDLPNVRATAAIFSAGTGIVDPYELSRSLIDDASDNGAEVFTQARVTAIERRTAGGYTLQTERGPVACDSVVNAAGLMADEIAAMAGAGRYRIYPCRGDYFRVRGNVPVAALVYPVRSRAAPGLGIHLTLGLDGSLRLGPDARYVASKVDFSEPADVKALREVFFAAASRYLIGLKPDRLEYDSCGIRPKLRAPGDAEESDFVLREDLPGFINLVGIESPGLTAALDLAKRVARLLT